MAGRAPEAVGPLKAPDGQHVGRVELWGEYGMGAEYLRLVLDRPFDGVAEVHGTNVAPRFSPDGRLLLLTDRTTVLLLDYDTGAVRHWAEPEGWHHGIVLTELERFSVLALPDRSGASARTHAWGYAEARKGWGRGWGPAEGGLMPSLNRAMYTLLLEQGAFGSEASDS
jgi:hypothetical protein